MPKGYKFNTTPHGDILGWIERTRTWGRIGHYIGSTPPARMRGTYVTRPHDVACANYVPAHRPRRDEQALAAQQEVRDDPKLAADIERLWRETSIRQGED